MKLVWMRLVCLVMCASLLPAGAQGQACHKIPFAMHDGLLRLTVSNGSAAATTDLGLSVARSPSWLHLRNLPPVISSIAPDAGHEVACDFSVDRSAPVGVPDTLVLLVSTRSGERWIKRIPVVVLPPDRCELFQNYPNPFNPSTSVPFQISAAARVRLKVYNTLGQELAVLADEFLGPGYYERIWNALDAASGVYVCRLAIREGDGSEWVKVRRMAIVR